MHGYKGSPDDTFRDGLHNSLNTTKNTHHAITHLSCLGRSARHRLGPGD